MRNLSDIEYDLKLHRLNSDKILIEDTIKLLGNAIDPDSPEWEERFEVDWPYSKLYADDIEDSQGYQGDLKKILENFSTVKVSCAGFQEYFQNSLSENVIRALSYTPDHSPGQVTLKEVRQAYIKYLKKLLDRVEKRICTIERLASAKTKECLKTHSLVRGSNDQLRTVRHRSKKSSDEEVVIEKSIRSKLFSTITNFNNENRRHNKKRAA